MSQRTLVVSMKQIICRWEKSPRSWPTTNKPLPPLTDSRGWRRFFPQRERPCGWWCLYVASWKQAKDSTAKCRWLGRQMTGAQLIQFIMESLVPTIGDTAVECEYWQLVNEGDVRWGAPVADLRELKKQEMVWLRQSDLCTRVLFFLPTFCEYQARIKVALLYISNLSRGYWANGRCSIFYYLNGGIRWRPVLLEQLLSILWHLTIIVFVRLFLFPSIKYFYLLILPKSL